VSWGIEGSEVKATPSPSPTSRNGKLLLRIDLKELGKSIRPAIQYLESRLDEEVKSKRSQVTLTHTTARVAKLLLQKFLRQTRLEGYRILVVRSGLIEVRAPGKRKRPADRANEGARPSAWETIPDLWYMTPPGIIRPGRRAKKEKKRRLKTRAS
jgi:hypothetical protein